MVILGDPQVGKTTLRGLVGPSTYENYTKYFYFDISIKKDWFETLKISEKNLLHGYHIFELTDSNKYYKDRKDFYRLGTTSCCFVFDYSNQKSIDSLYHWFNVFSSHYEDNYRIPLILIGNKSDTYEYNPEVEMKIKQFKNRLNEWSNIAIPFVKICAKKGEGKNELDAFIENILILHKLINRSKIKQSFLEWAKEANDSDIKNTKLTLNELMDYITEQPKMIIHEIMF